jgi:hypothetical protein
MATGWTSVRSRSGILSIGLASTFLLSPLAAKAQYIPSYFPVGVPGYNQQLGVTVVTRVRPLYEEPGIQVGSFTIRPDLDETVGYNDNVLGFRGGPGSPTVVTSPSVSINSDWSRDALGASFSAQDSRYPDTPSQNTTNWNAAIGGTYAVGRGDVSVAYSHSTESEAPTDIGAPPTTTPIPYTVDDFRTYSTIDLGRIKITPNFEYSQYRYGSAAVIGQTSNQSFRDSDIAQGGATLHYEVSDQGSLLLVLQGINSHFINPEPNSPSLSSTSGIVMGGVDYQYDGVWRYQLLAGVEVRSFAASQFGTRVEPIVEATGIWTPTGLTTVTGTLVRSVDDPTEPGTSGYTYTGAELRVDHEYRRNVLLNGEIGTRIAQYQQPSGTQTQLYASAGVTWLLNRHMSLSAQYTFTNQDIGSGSETVNPTTNTALFNGNYAQNVITLTLHVGL